MTTIEELIQEYQAATTSSMEAVRNTARLIATHASGLARHAEDSLGSSAEKQEAAKAFQAALESRFKAETVREVCETLAKALNLYLRDDFDPVEAIRLDIQRLQKQESRYLTACEIAAKHCPVEWGESHIRDGIPRLAKKAAEEFERGRLEGRKEVNTAEYARGFSEGRQSLREAARTTLLELQDQLSLDI